MVSKVQNLFKNLVLNLNGLKLKHFHTHMKSSRLILYATIYLLVQACTSVKEYNPVRNFENKQKELISKFIMASDSSIIELGEGHFIFSKSLILEGKNNVVIRGAGMNKTILSFKGQTEGAEGIRVANCNNITLQGFTIEDAAGDNIKVTDTKGIIFKRIRSAWTGEVNSENGAYGLYPVLCQNVVVQNCEVLGASDAGIYVGQSKNVVISNNRVKWNVAGIESENSRDVLIFENHAYENTGGILAFDLPGLTMYGNNVHIFDNRVHDNNMDNFAPAGNMVSIVPPGTGILILATQNVEVYQNLISDNKTIGIGIISYAILEALGGEDNTGGGGSREELESRHEEDVNYNPWVGNINIHDNLINSTYTFPDLGNDFGKLFLLNFGTDLPHIAWDGLRSPDFLLPDGSSNPDYRICITEDETITAVNLDAANDFENIEINPEIFDCGSDE